MTSVLYQTIIYTVYQILSIKNHIKNLAPFFITKLRQQLIIIGYLWIKKYKVLLNIINNSITFFLEYFIHLKAFSNTLTTDSLQSITCTRLLVDRVLAEVYDLHISFRSRKSIFALIKVRKDIYRITSTLISIIKKIFWKKRACPNVLLT